MKFNFKIEDINYIKILCRNIDSTPVAIKAGIKGFDEKEILACAKLSTEMKFETPQEITLSIICKDGLYRTKTTLKYVVKEEPYHFFCVQTPQTIEYEQNREFFRVPVNYDCVYKVSSEGRIREFNTKTVDISANGICINLPQHIISETYSEISVNINGHVINTKIKYVRSQKTADGYKISFSYTNIKDADRDFISQICLQKQLEERRKNLK